jgi:hypothetical protein
MDIHDEQRQMLTVLKRPGAFGDPWMSPKLEFQKTIIVWWRCFQLEHWLMITTKVLKDQTIFEPLVRNLYCYNNIRPTPAEAAEGFVRYLECQPISPTIKSIAALELALIKIKDPEDKNEYRISWTQSPLSLLNALILAQEYFLETENGGKYETIVSNRIPEKMVVRELH